MVAVSRHVQAGAFAGGGGGGAGADGEGSAAALAERHDELMDSILLEEENLVAFHRAKLEEDMETMRQEMALLQEVDKPGSEIDHYVEQMSALLNIKRQGIQELQVGMGVRLPIRDWTAGGRLLWSGGPPLLVTLARSPASI